MARLALVSLCAGVVAVGCGDSGGSMPTGETLYLERHADGNVFACAACHALEEPAPDGLRRPGHPIGTAANRPSFKNGQLNSLLDAVNTCRVEWMAARPFTANEERWLALSSYLEEEAGDTAAPAVTFEIVDPPGDLDGGDEMVGQGVFNGSCAVCHGQDAVGTERAPALRGQLLTAELIAERVRLSGTVNSSVYEGLTGGRMPFWAADRLSDEELLDVVAFVLSNDGGGVNGGGGGELRDCDSTDPKIGQEAVLMLRAHQVSGTAIIVDDCTIRLDDFVYDGGGIDVRFYGGLGGDYLSGFPMSGDIRRAEGYDGTETVYAQLPVGRTLSELDGISVWCVTATTSFGDGLFQDP